MRNLSSPFVFQLLLSFFSKGSDAIRLHPNDLRRLTFDKADPHTPLMLLNETTARTAHRRAKVTVEIPSSPDGHLVSDLPLTKPGEELKTRHWAGHLPAKDDGENYFFYWLFEPENVNEDTPLLIWLNGGPACSSMDGLFLENGPIQWTVVDGEYKLQQNPYSWHKAPAYTLYIDQPVGTGLSFTTNKKYPKNDEEVNTDFYHFLTQFFNLHADKFVKDSSVNSPLYFSGESHAGHYIPSMMNFILKKNNDGASLTIPLAGAAIGNGWMDPMVQYAGAEAAYGHGLLGRGHVNALAEKEIKCQEALKKGNYRASICFDLLDDVVSQSYGSKSAYKVSQYDVRVSEKRGAPRTFPKGHKVVEGYLGGHNLPAWETGTLDPRIKTSVLKALHASAADDARQIFYECTDPPYTALAHQDGKGVVDDIVDVLQDPSAPVLLVFNGIEDLICNHVGNEKALENLPWKGQTQWVEAKRYAWMPFESSTKPAGFMKEYQNLKFLKIIDAGHMVPMDQPEISLKMISILMSKGSFADEEQGIAASSTEPAPPCPICPDCSDSGDESCIKCSEALTPNEPTCSKEVEKAKQKAIALAKKQQSHRKASFVWAIPFACLIAVLVLVISLRRRIEGRSTGYSNPNTEISDHERYTDEPDDDDTGIPHGNGEGRE